MRACAGIEVTLPHRVPVAEVPAILDRHHDWLMQRYHFLVERGQGPGQSVMPERIECPCIGRVFSVRYVQGAELRLRSDGTALTLQYPAGKKESGASLLCRFLIRLGTTHLVPMCTDLARACTIPIAGVGIRNQSTRWGSCSPRGHISLNAKLLLLPQELARHIMLHELCHVAHRNHGPQFKAALQDLDPGTPEHEKALRPAWENLPAWCKVRSGSI